MQALIRQQEDDEADDGSVTEPDSDPDEIFEQALQFAAHIYEIVFRRWGDKNTLSFIHTTLVFMLRMSQLPAAISHLEDRYPWKLASMMLNYLLKTIKKEPRIDTEDFPGQEKKSQEPVPLPEDYALRGLLFADDFFPKGWFDNERLDETDRYLEATSKTLDRQERILWIGRRIADSGKWLTWDDKARRFGVDSKYDFELEGLPSDNQSAGNVTTVDPGPAPVEIDIDDERAS
ncbi:hypothetical protein JDV02_001419 [Purpureocillium takamizusanense]|uniref:Uncharacterized protein n=1 Tax=Purpureocillium takamizusanense TaxID=2060973 RepID=A0A9Q8Q721_9HYPO|nr:uncharacterized protein JDV02_001419 [Purpureocillium takamizusanense]UNI14828.1 hypothetical protein JDV02_001419 [Purpureocillium takamizusanense]